MADLATWHLCFTVNHPLRGICALVIVVLVRGTTFPAMKDLAAACSPVWIILVRFMPASLILSPFLWRARRADLLSGVVLGLVLFLCYLFQVEGLALTGRGSLGGALLISGMIVSQWNTKGRPAAALAPE